MATMDDYDPLLERLEAEDFPAPVSRLFEARPVKVLTEEVGTAHGVWNAIRFHNFSRVPAGYEPPDDCPDVPLSTLCQSASPSDEPAMDYDEEMAW